MTERKVACCMCLDILAWLLAVASLPIYFMAMIGVGTVALE